MYAQTDAMTNAAIDKKCGGGGRGRDVSGGWGCGSGWDLQQKRRQARNRQSLAKQEFQEDSQGTGALLAALHGILQTIFQLRIVRLGNLSRYRGVY